MKKAKYYAAFGLALASSAVVIEATGVSALAPTSANNITITRNVTDAYVDVTNTFEYGIDYKDKDSSNCTTLDTANSTLPFTMSINFNDVAPSNSNVATASDVIDLTGLAFKDGVVGECMLQIEEYSSTDSTNYPISTEKKYFSIMTQYVTDSNGSPVANAAGNYQTELVVSNPFDSTDQANKGAVFTAAADLHSYAVVNKEVRGNFADPTKNFEFKVTIPNTYHSSGTYTLIPYAYNAGTDDYTAGVPVNCNYGSNNCTVSIAHKGYFTIGRTSGRQEQLLPGRDTITVEEMNATGYTVYLTDGFLQYDEQDITSTHLVANNRAVQPDAENNEMTVTNEMTHSPQTGKFFSVLPFIILGGVAGLGVAMTIKKKVTVKVQK